jgi:nicotinamide-nucleotide amidase
MASDRQLYALAVRLGQALRSSGHHVVTAESCTSGWIAKAITDVAGSSQWFDSAYVTYSNEAKRRDLGVSTRTLARHGAVSEETVREMARGALRATGADLAIAVSGIAGPDGGTRVKPVGSVWFCIAAAGRRRPVLTTSFRRFKGGRDSVRRKAVEHALQLMHATAAGRPPRA